MEELEKDSELAIVLNIIEGTGLNSKKHLVVIEASLGGNVLETNSIIPGDLTTQFDCNLIWAADKISVKQMRDENLPIKLRCFSIAPNGERESIGFVLIQMRTVVYSFGQKFGKVLRKVKPRWYKLLGVSTHWRQHRPELLLSVSLTDKNHIDGDTAFSDEAKDLLGIKIDQKKDEPSSMLIAEDGLHIQVLREGLIQIGDQDDDLHQFHVIIHLQHAEQIRDLISSSSPFGKTIKLKYSLFGNPTHIDLPANMGDHIPIDEKITIKFRSSLKMLKTYFLTKFSIPIELMCNDAVIGHAQMKFGEVMVPLPTTVTEFIQIFGSERNTFHLEDYSRIQPSSPMPHIEAKIQYTFGIKYIRSMELEHMAAGKRKISPILPDITDDNGNKMDMNDVLKAPAVEKASGDNASYDNQMKIRREERIISPMDIHLSPSVSPKRAACPIPSSPRHIAGSAAKRSLLKTFSYSLVFIDCKFDRKPLAGIYQISLNHLDADNPLAMKSFTIPEGTIEIVNLSNLEINLSFTTDKNRLVEKINSQPCLLTLKGPKGFRAIAELDNESILSHEKITGIIVFENDLEEQTAMAHVFVELKDLGPNFNVREKHLVARRRSPHTPRMDEDIAYKAIEELEEWKAKQKEQFVGELRRREISHLAHLSNEWQRRRTEEETKLANKLEHCELLTKSLEEAYAAMREKNEMVETREKYWSKAKEDIERKCEAKVRESSDRVRELEQEAALKTKQDELKRMELGMRSKFLDEENGKLKERVRELEILVQNSLPKEQVAELYSELATLSEKNEREYNSKLFYKKQWTRAIREQYYRKMEAMTGRTDQMSPRDNIQEIIDSARSDLNIERDELQEIKRILARYSYN